MAQIMEAQRADTGLIARGDIAAAQRGGVDMPAILPDEHQIAVPAGDGRAPVTVPTALACSTVTAGASGALASGSGRRASVSANGSWKVLGQQCGWPGWRRGGYDAWPLCPALFACPRRAK